MQSLFAFISIKIKLIMLILASPLILYDCTKYKAVFLQTDDIFEYLFFTSSKYGIISIME